MQSWLLLEVPLEGGVAGRAGQDEAGLELGEVGPQRAPTERLEEEGERADGDACTEREQDRVAAEDPGPRGGARIHKRRVAAQDDRSGEEDERPSEVKLGAERQAREASAQKASRPGPKGVRGAERLRAESVRRGARRRHGQE
jgi:hypothetical protein